jgi:hypothetical protein
MAITVDKSGNVLGTDGKWYRTAQSADFVKSIQDAQSQASANGDGKAADNVTAYAIVQKNDYLLKIGRQYGVDSPNKLAYTDNEQYEDNPDLIHTGDAVFIRGGDAKAGAVDAKYLQEIGATAISDPGTGPKVDKTAAPAAGSFEAIDYAAKNGGNVQDAVAAYLDAPAAGGKELTNEEFVRRVEKVYDFDFGLNDKTVNETLVNAAHKGVTERLRAGKPYTGDGDPSNENRKTFINAYFGALELKDGDKKYQQDALDKLKRQDFGEDPLNWLNEDLLTDFNWLVLNYAVTPVAGARGLSIDMPSDVAWLFGSRPS